MKDILTNPKSWDAIASGYDDQTRKLLTPFSAAALEWLELDANDQFLDVACGPGTTTLLACDRVRGVDAIDFSKEMIAGLRRHTAGRNNVTAVVGDGQRLPYSSEHFSVACSMFGLMFFPDPDAGLCELLRVLRPGGRALIASWVPMPQSPMMQPLLNAMQHAMPPKPDDPPPSPLPFDSAESLAYGLAQAGFVDVEVRSFSPDIAIDGAEGYWREFRDNVFINHLRTVMGSAWHDVEARIREHLQGSLEGVTKLAMPALLGRGTKPT